MTTDGRIMLGILREFVTKAGKPALGIHDSLVCKAIDADLALKMMRSVYFRFMLFKPVIKRVY